MNVNDFDKRILSHIKNPTHYYENFEGIDIMEYAKTDLIPKGLIIKGKAGEWYMTPKGAELLAK